jgi:very-short-patch-repair endonuclease
MPSSKRKMPPECRISRARGYRMICFWNRDVIDNLPGVLELIQQDLNSERK